jgi:RNA polymerase sigma-70 factor (ECF subfamily)
LSAVDLARCFVEELRGKLAENRSGDLAWRLEQMIDQARRKWPEIALEPERFVRYVAARVPAEQPLAALDDLACTDLYLACACADNHPRALAALEASYLAQTRTWIASHRPTTAFVDEVKQVLRERLLVASRPGEPPRIATYSGNGPLAGWLRVAAVRVAIDLRRSDQPLAPQDHVIGDAVLQDAASGPELRLLKARYRSQIAAAFRSTLAALGDKERTILRMFFLDGMTTAQIGALYQVHGATVSRWVAQARASILAETRRLLAKETQLATQELESVLRLAHSSLDVSIVKHLRAERRSKKRR